MADDQDAADFPVLMDDGHADRLFQQVAGDLQLQCRDQAAFPALPTGQQLALGIEHLRVGHLFGGGDQGQCFVGGDLVVEHHRRFHGVIDGAGDQVQVVIGIHPQCQHAEHGQGQAGHGHPDQRHDQVAPTNDRTQGRTPLSVEQVHGATALRRESCSTLG